MTPELQRRLSASLPPFDGTTIAVCDDPTVDEVLDMLQFISGQLATQNGDLFLFDDWHEHDGFLTEPKTTDRNRTIYTVDLGKRIGFIGGQDGGRRRNPMARRVRLVLEGKRVITAYPM
jgi:hypothetical protein